MNLSLKYSNLCNRFLDFINGLDDDFISLKVTIKTITESQTDDLPKSIAQLQELNNLFTTIFKGIKEANLKEKSEISEQLLNHSDNSESPSTINVYSPINRLIQTHLKNFDVTYSETTHKFNRPVIGSFWLETNKWLDQIKESNIGKLKRSNEVVLSISEKTKESLFIFLRTNFTKFVENDVDFYNQRIENAHIEIKNLLESNGIFNYEFPKLEFNLSQKSEDIISSSLRIDNPFQGSYRKVNFRSVILEIRSYTTMFILVMSTLGFNRQFGTNDSFMQFFYIISFTLLALGILSTYINIQNTKTDTMEAELNKAKINLTNEIKRVVNEFVNEWRSIISRNFNTSLNELSFAAQQIVGEYTEELRKKAQIRMNEKTNLTQLLQQSESKDRGLNIVINKCESFKLQMDTLKNEIQAYSNLTN